MKAASYCSQCGAPVDVNAKFCTACGNPLEIPAVAAKVPAVPIDREDSRLARDSAPDAAPTSGQLTDSSALSSSNPTGLLTSGVVYVLVYLVLAVPTYILPYFGSNSSVLNVLGATMGLGALPQFWFHLVALYLLVIVAWIRGGHIGKQWLAIFPVLAGIFDMVPGFSLILLLPTIFHVLAIVIGVSGKLVAVADHTRATRRLAVSGVGFAAIVILALFKTQAFFQNADRGPPWEVAKKTQEVAPSYTPAPVARPQVAPDQKPSPTASGVGALPGRRPPLAEAQENRVIGFKVLGQQPGGVEDLYVVILEVEYVYSGRPFEAAEIAASVLRKGKKFPAVDGQANIFPGSNKTELYLRFRPSRAKVVVETDEIEFKMQEGGDTTTPDTRGFLTKRFPYWNSWNYGIR